MKYFNNFSSLQNVKDEFSSVDSEWKKLHDVELEEHEVILASYSGATYKGDAIVLFRRNGKLYEVHGSHCSCSGLEGQWQPEEVSLQDLEYRFDNGNTSHFVEEHGQDVLDAMRRIIFGEVLEREVLLN